MTKTNYVPKPARVYAAPSVYRSQRKAEGFVIDSFGQRLAPHLYLFRIFIVIFISWLCLLIEFLARSVIKI